MTRWTQSRHRIRLLAAASAGTAVAVALLTVGPAAGATPHGGKPHVATTAVTADDITQTGAGQQRWLSVPGSRIAANPIDSTLTGGEVSQNSSAALPLGSNYIADDTYTQDRGILQTSISDTATPPAVAAPAGTALPQPLTAANGWSAKYAAAAGDGSGTTVTVASGSDWGAIVKTVTVDLDTTPYLSLNVGAVHGTWNLKLNLTPNDAGDDEPAIQSPSSDTGTFRFDVAAQYGLHGTQTFAVRLFVEGGAGSTARFDGVGFSAEDSFPAVGASPAFDDGFLASDMDNWVTTSGDATITSTGEEATVEINKNAASGSVMRQVTVNLDTDPVLAIDVPRLTGKWALKLHDQEQDKDFTLQGDTADHGVFTYDIPQLTGWSGTRTFSIKIYALGKQYSTTTYNRVAIMPSGVDGWEQRASDDTTTWTPQALRFDATYGTSGTLTGNDHFHGTDALVRTVDAGGIYSGTVTFGGAYTGTIDWDAAAHVLTVTEAHDTRSIALPPDATVSFSQPAGWAPSATPTASTTRWNATVPVGKSYDIGLGYAVGDDAAAARSAATAAQSADPAADVAAWRDYWNGLLAKVPTPQDFSVHGVDTAGVGAGAVKSAYYRGWVNLEENVLPATPETGNQYAALGTDKAGNWMKGTPGTANVGSWDSLLGIQDLVYVDPTVAWDTYRGMWAMEKSDGSLGGESLASRKAQTGWILYRVTGDESKLAADYDALSKQLVWESQHLHWVTPTSETPDQVSVTFVTSLIVDLQYAEKIAQAVGRSADVQKWTDLRSQLETEYEQTLFTSDGTTLSDHFLNGSSPDVPSNGIGVFTGFDVLDLPQTYVDMLDASFDTAYDPNLQFAGMAANALKAPHEQLTVYGLIDRGRTSTAGVISNAVLRDVVRSGRFSEVYVQAGDTLSGTPIGNGVWPSLFGISNIIDAVWMNNGYRLDRGEATAVHFPGASGGITGLTQMGQPYSTTNGAAKHR